MAIDMAKIRNRLNSLSNTNSRTQYLWKPQAGKQVVRIVPYTHNEDNPFIELYFHYNINNKSYLSPSSFGRPDPFVELSDKLKSTGDKEDYRMGKKLEPKMRTFVPVLIRGEEELGVRFWGFGKQVYQELLGIIADPDYGDITDLKEGRDITVEFKTAEEAGKNFPETTIRIKPNVSKVTDDKTVFSKIKEQKDITELYNELPYDELKDILEKWLSGEPDQDDESVEDESPNSVIIENDDVEDDDVSVTQETKTSKSEKSSSKKSDIESEFDELFNE